jgi:phosphodiesterase/alkaline phosphatase D-like protein
MPWNEVATQIQSIESANRFSVETIAFTNAGYTNWLHNGMLSSGQTWNVICVTMPTWTIFQRNQVSWSGAFVFHENLV